MNIQSTQIHIPLLGKHVSTPMTYLTFTKLVKILITTINTDVHSTLNIQRFNNY